MWTSHFNREEAVEGECAWALEPVGPDSKPVLLLCDFGQVTEPLGASVLSLEKCLCVITTLTW